MRHNPRVLCIFDGPKPEPVPPVCESSKPTAAAVESTSRPADAVRSSAPSESSWYPRVASLFHHRSAMADRVAPQAKSVYGAKPTPGVPSNADLLKDGERNTQFPSSSSVPESKNVRDASPLPVGLSSCIAPLSDADDVDFYVAAKLGIADASSVAIQRSFSRSGSPAAGSISLVRSRSVATPHVAIPPPPQPRSTEQLQISRTHGGAAATHSQRRIGFDLVRTTRTATQRTSTPGAVPSRDYARPTAAFLAHAAAAKEMRVAKLRTASVPVTRPAVYSAEATERLASTPRLAAAARPVRAGVGVSACASRSGTPPATRLGPKGFRVARIRSLALASHTHPPPHSESAHSESAVVIRDIFTAVRLGNPAVVLDILATTSVENASAVRDRALKLAMSMGQVETLQALLQDMNAREVVNSRLLDKMVHQLTAICLGSNKKTACENISSLCESVILQMFETVAERLVASVPVNLSERSGSQSPSPVPANADDALSFTEVEQCLLFALLKLIIPHRHSCDRSDHQAYTAGAFASLTADGPAPLRRRAAEVRSNSVGAVQTARAVQPPSPSRSSRFTTPCGLAAQRIIDLLWRVLSYTRNAIDAARYDVILQIASHPAVCIASSIAAGSLHPTCAVSVARAILTYRPAAASASIFHSLLLQSVSPSPLRKLVRLALHDGPALRAIEEDMLGLSQPTLGPDVLSVALSLCGGLSSLLSHDPSGDVLFAAAKGGNLAVLKRLLPTYGINAMSNEGSLVHSAAVAPNTDILNYILQHRHFTLGVDNRTKLGITPLYVACQHGNDAAIVALLEAGANPSIQASTDGFTPLIAAAAADQPSAITTLHKNSAVDIDELCDSGMTALHVASLTGCAAAVKSLLSCGARSELLSSNGFAAVDLARENGHDSVATIIERFEEGNVGRSYIAEVTAMESSMRESPGPVACLSAGTRQSCQSECLESSKEASQSEVNCPSPATSEPPSPRSASDAPVSSRNIFTPGLTPITRSSPTPVHPGVVPTSLTTSALAACDIPRYPDSSNRRRRGTPARRSLGSASGARNLRTTDGQQLSRKNASDSPAVHAIGDLSAISMTPIPRPATTGGAMDETAEVATPSVVQSHVSSIAESSPGYSALRCLVPRSVLTAVLPRRSSSSSPSPDRSPLSSLSASKDGRPFPNSVLRCRTSNVRDGDPV